MYIDYAQIEGLGSGGSPSGGILSVFNFPVDGAKATYSAGIVALVPVTLATDVFLIKGSASKTIRITRISITLTTTAGAGTAVNMNIVKRSTANSGGTSTTLTNVPHDSTNAAGTAAVLAYTANPTVGSIVGITRAVRYAVNGPNQVNVLNWEFGSRPSQAIVLRGVAESLALNFNGTTVSAPVADIDVEWTEE